VIAIKIYALTQTRIFQSTQKTKSNRICRRTAWT